MAGSKIVPDVENITKKYSEIQNNNKNKNKKTELNTESTTRNKKPNPKPKPDPEPEALVVPTSSTESQNDVVSISEQEVRKPNVIEKNDRKTSKKNSKIESKTENNKGKLNADTTQKKRKKPEREPEGLVVATSSTESENDVVNVSGQEVRKPKVIEKNDRKTSKKISKIESKKENNKGKLNADSTKKKRKEPEFVPEPEFPVVATSSTDSVSDVVRVSGREEESRKRKLIDKDDRKRSKKISQIENKNKKNKEKKPMPAEEQKPKPKPEALVVGSSSIDSQNDVVIGTLLKKKAKKPKNNEKNDGERSTKIENQNRSKKSNVKAATKKKNPKPEPEELVVPSSSMESQNDVISDSEGREVEKSSKKSKKNEKKEQKSKGEGKRKESEEAERKESGMYKFPMRRVSRIIKSENADKKISEEAVFVINKASEKFLELFSKEAYACAFLDKNNYVGYNHLSSAVSKRQRFHFLSDFVPEKVKAEDALAELSKNDL